MNKKIISPTLLVILIIIGIMILSMFFYYFNKDLIINYKCSKDSSNCVCETTIFIYPLDFETGMFCNCIDTTATTEDNITVWGKGCCSKYRYKTEEEKYCESNPNDEDKCECKEYKCFKDYLVINGIYTNETAVVLNKTRVIYINSIGVLDEDDSICPVYYGMYNNYYNKSNCHLRIYVKEVDCNKEEYAVTKDCIKAVPKERK